MLRQGGTLTQSRLRSLVSYDDETGVFIRLIASGTAKVGDVAGWTEPNGYRKLCLDGRKYYAHRCVFLYVHGEWPVGVDHIDGNPGNNRLSNLRAVSQMINIQNLRGPRKDNRSGRLGVYFHRAAGKFAAEIKVPDKRIFLGLFPTRDEAYAAYLAAKQQLHEGNTLC